MDHLSRRAEFHEALIGRCDCCEPGTLPRPRNSAPVKAAVPEQIRELCSPDFGFIFPVVRNPYRSVLG